MPLLSEASDPLRFVTENLARHAYAVISTINEDGSPWAVCVAVNVSPQLEIVWLSRTDTLHSRNIERDERVSICIYSKSEETGDFGFYARAKAHAVDDPIERAACIDLKTSQNGKAPPDSVVSGEAPLRFYKAVADAVWVNDDTHQKQPIDLGGLYDADNQA